MGIGNKSGAVWTLHIFSFQRIFDAAYIYFCTKVKEPVKCLWVY